MSDAQQDLHKLVSAGMSAATSSYVTARDTSPREQLAVLQMARSREVSDIRRSAKT